MSPFFKVQPNPFRFLLYTEWVMLASCASLAVAEALEKQYIPVQHVLILALLGLMGLRLPSGKLLYKLLYTAIEIGLIFYGTTRGYLHILPTLYIIVVIRSCFLFDLPGRWAVAGLSFILFVIHQVQYVQSITVLVLPGGLARFWMHQLAEILVFGLGLLFVLQLANKLLAERQTREQLAIAHEQLRHYAFQIEEVAALQERNRIARDIHDSLGHSLTTLNVQLRSALKLWSVDLVQSQTFLAEAQRLGASAMQEVRRSVSSLRGDTLKEQSLEVLIQSLVEDFHHGTGVLTFTNIHLDTSLPREVVVALYRIVQESLTNICKHAEATEVHIQLGATREEVYLMIRDNGRGFNLNSNMTGFGLQGMRERVAALKGRFHIATEPGFGCRITVELPREMFLHKTSCINREQGSDK
ncbi:MAG TPA: sensor histidine kinase [Coleofasciculaceae cyanobacterium]|jgi:signal transduction histidine kinase